MADDFSARLVPVNCDQLQLGMYVAELDRSWLHTPFHHQGFLITQDSQITELGRCCAYVYVDPLQSHDSAEDAFASGLTTRARTLPAGEPPSVTERTRADLRRLAHRLAEVVRSARRAGELALGPLRHDIESLVAALAVDPDTLPWLVVTELKVNFLLRRAIGSSVLLAGFGSHLGFDRPVITELALGGLLLDIGKISVPVPILAKPGQLTSHEREFVNRHVRRGLYMARMATAISPVMEEMLLGHHERLDGHGYPRGLRGTHIPLFARMAGIVDTFDAMTQDRRYAAASSPHDALRLVNGMRGTKFDAALVRAFIRGVGIYPAGSWVQLADGRLGIVRSQTPDEPLRPHIALVSDSAGRALAPGMPLWQPIRRSDIVRALAPAEMHVSQRIVDQAVTAATNLAA